MDDDTGDASQDAPDPNPANPETRSKLSLLEGTYKEVLDATKHQDDKIGRLLTAIAFLTAAALALSNLGAGKYIGAEFDLGGSTFRLGILALAAFLICVFVSVVLLVNSFATPLRVPGLRSPDTDQAPDIPWVNGVRGSQIYFSEIAQMTTEQWAGKWSAPEESLQAELERSLIYETHNLSVRTNFKYERTSEGIAVFAMAMLAFVLAVFFVTTSVTRTPIATAGDAASTTHSDLQFRLLLALLTAGYIGLQLLSRIRYNMQAKHEGPKRGGPRMTQQFFAGQIAFLLAAVGYVWMLLFTSPHDRPNVCCMALLGILWVLAVVTSQNCRPDAQRPCDACRYRNIALGLAIGVGALVAGFWALSPGTYTRQFWAGMAAAFGTLLLAALLPLWSDARSRLGLTCRSSHTKGATAEGTEAATDASPSSSVPKR